MFDDVDREVADGTRRGRCEGPLGMRPEDERRGPSLAAYCGALDILRDWTSDVRFMDWWIALPRATQGRDSTSRCASLKSAVQSATTCSMGGAGDGKP